MGIFGFVSNMREEFWRYSFKKLKKEGRRQEMAEIAPGNIHVIRNYNMNKLYEIISLKQFIIIIIYL